VCLCLLLATSAAAESRWWMDEPIRLLQTDLRETDSTLDAQREKGSEMTIDVLCGGG